MSMNRIPQFISAAAAALSAVLLISSCGSSCCGEVEDFSALYKDLPFEMPVLSRPSIPSYTVDITDFGGVGDGVTLNTEAFAKAMKHLSDKGGGHLNVPAGIWLTGPVGILSNCDLHITKNAILLFDPDRDLYPVINTVFEGLDTKRCESPVYADGATNISITGGGVIDGAGDSWRPLKKSKVSDPFWEKKVASGGIVLGSQWYPDAGYLLGMRGAVMNVPSPDVDVNAIKSFLRPVMISLRNCENVLLEDCLFQNSPAWNIHPLMCKNLIINNITVRNPEYSQNGDGIDVDSCENVIILNSTFDCGDDGICIKSGKDADGRRRARPCENLIISGCTVYHGHGGFVVGSEMSGGVKNIKVSGCRFLGTDVGLRFKSTRGRGGVVEGIWIDNIYMTDIVSEAVLFNLYYNGSNSADRLIDGVLVKGSDIAQPVDETTPCFRDIHISKVVCNGANQAMLFKGLPEMPVKGIDISDCTISSRKGVELSWSEDVTLRNTDIRASEGEPLSTWKVTNFKNIP